MAIVNPKIIASDPEKRGIRLSQIFFKSYGGKSRLLVSE